jgi:membrane-bound metal-dependent hydrolase YbcI (DUF457 family)
MPLAVMHVLVPIILLDIYRDYFMEKKSMLPNHMLFLAGAAGLMVDLDLPLSILGSWLGLPIPAHRILSHNIWIPLTFLALSLFFRYKKSKMLWKIFLMFAIGTASHLLLDATLVGTIAPFYPVNEVMWGLNLVSSKWTADFAASLDAILLLLWLSHEELKHKISDYL